MANFGDVVPARVPKRVEGIETPYEPAAGNEPGGVIVSDAQRRALGPIRGYDNSRGTSTDKRALGYTIDSVGRWTGEGNLGKVEASGDLHQYMASNQDHIAQAARQTNDGRLAQKAFNDDMVGLAQNSLKNKAKRNRLGE